MGHAARDRQACTSSYGLVGSRSTPRPRWWSATSRTASGATATSARGNYNSKTARVYEDVGLLTCDPDIGADLSQLFNYLTGYGRDVQYRRLLVAPQTAAHRARASCIDNEIQVARNGGDGRIILKMNSLVDPEHDRPALRGVAGRRADRPDRARASAASCPGVPGLSENIRVRSIVGRYLEHSRIYRVRATARGTASPTC